jgi:hypothetical protein
MKKQIFFTVLSLLSVSSLNLSCQKQNIQKEQEDQSAVTPQSQRMATPPFNLEIILRGDGKRFGHVKFRQDNDIEKIIDLGVWVRHLAPNHTYLLQRAVDAINIVDGNCTSTSWLTLGKGLTPQAIITDEKGTGREDLWRSVAALPTGSKFDIHFRVVDAITKAVVLTSVSQLVLVQLPSTILIASTARCSRYVWFGARSRTQTPRSIIFSMSLSCLNFTRPNRLPSPRSIISKLKGGVAVL